MYGCLRQADIIINLIAYHACPQANAEPDLSTCEGVSRPTQSQEGFVEGCARLVLDQPGDQISPWEYQVPADLIRCL